MDVSGGPLTSSFTLDQKALLMYRPRPLLMTSLPNCLYRLAFCSYEGCGPDRALPASPVAFSSPISMAPPLSSPWAPRYPGPECAVSSCPSGDPVDADACLSPSICPLSSSTIPSSFLNRSKSSVSRRFDPPGCPGGASGSLWRGLRGARPGDGKMHWMWLRRQLVQGMRLSQRTLRRRQVTQLRGLMAAAPGAEAAVAVEGMVCGAAVPGERTVKAGTASGASGASGVSASIIVDVELPARGRGGVVVIAESAVRSGGGARSGRRAICAGIGS